MNSVKCMGIPLNTNSIQENSFFEKRVSAVLPPILAARLIGSHSVPVPTNIQKKKEKKTYWSVSVPIMLYDLE